METRVPTTLSEAVELFGEETALNLLRREVGMKVMARKHVRCPTTGAGAAWDHEREGTVVRVNEDCSFPLFVDFGGGFVLPMAEEEVREI